MSATSYDRRLAVERFANFQKNRDDRKSLFQQRLTFELTETSAIEDPIASLDTLTRLRMKGFQLSIDDFGTGYSSMLQLVRMPFTEIRVDKSFIISSMRSNESRAVVVSIVDPAQGHWISPRAAAVGPSLPALGAQQPLNLL